MRPSSFRFLYSVMAALAVVFAFALPARAQVVFDAASNATPATVSTANPVPDANGIRWNHTTGSAKKMYLTVGISIRLSGGTASVGSVTYGNEAGGPVQLMTFLGAVSNGTLTRAEIWGLAAPTAGTHEIKVLVNNPGGQNVVVVAGAKSFSNVFQTASVGAAATNTGTTLTPTVTVPVASNSSTFDYVVDAVAYNNNVALTPGAGQTNTYNLTNAAPVFSGAGSIETGSTGTVMSWTATGVAAAWATVAVPLHSASPQLLFDAASSPGVATNSATNPVNVSWSHVTTTAANRYVIVEVTMQCGNTAGKVVASVTYGTEVGGPNLAMTRIGAGQTSSNNHVRVEMWGVIAPTSGTHTITASVTNAGGTTITVAAGAQTFSNVDQSTPLGTTVVATNTSTVPTVAVTNSAYDYVVDAVAFDINTGLTPGLTQDQRFQITNAVTNNFTGAASGSRGYTNTTMQWAGLSSVRWAIQAVPLKQAGVIVTKTTTADVIKTGDRITYTLTATNYGSASAAAVTITDNIPAGTSFVSQTGCSGTGPVTCNVGTLPSGATSAAFTITVVPNTPGTVSNVATVTYTGATNPNSSETVRTLVEGSICANPGKDGIGGTLAGVKNDYWPGTGNPTAGATTMSVGARTAGGLGSTITAGDLLIIMQMQDAAFDTSNDETYGEGTGSTRATGTGSGAAVSLNNAGRWEYVIASNTVLAAGGALTFTGGGAGGGLLYTYTAQAYASSTTQGQRTFQVIRVPQYSTATLGSTLTALPWNGATGGVLAIDVSGTMALGSATVSVNGLGFRGGGGIKLKSGIASTAGYLFTDFRTPAPDATLTTNTANGSKGEGIAGTPRWVYQSGSAIGAPGVNAPLDTGVEGYVSGSFGRGAPGNAGGGSTDGNPAGDNGFNSGGGGGGNGGNGGPGGNSWSSNKPSGGQGGGGITPKLTRITMGGGGGAGTTNNGSATDATGTPLADDNNGPGTTASANGYYSSGANGGGIIIIRALQATGTATLTANGFNAYNTGRDGSGGGGAGGSILLTTQMGTITGATIQAKGGKGGSAWLQQAPAGSPGERHGPGGGGGGGYILLSSAAASTDVSAGGNGFTTSANDNYGAQPGSPGIIEMISGNNVLPGGDGATCAIADLAVTNVVSPTSVVGGLNLTFTQTAANNGPSPADGVVYMAPIPANSSFVSFSTPPPGWTCVLPAVGATTGAVICTTPTMNSGATANFSLVVRTFSAAPGYVVSETNSISSNTTDSNPANNQATASAILEAGSQTQNGDNVDMAVTISESTAYPNVGNNINYTQTISNLGDVAAKNPTYTLTTPPNTTFQSLGTPPVGWTCITPAVNATGTISCSSSTPLAAGASFSLPLSLKVTGGIGTPITASPSVGTSSTDTYMPNNTASVTATPVAAGAVDVAITIANSPKPVSPGQNYTYTVVASNNGPPTAATNVVTIPLPLGTTFQSMPVPAGWACSTPAVGTNGTITCNIASLAAGATATFLPVVKVDNSTVAGTVLNITSTISTATTETITANNTASTSNLVAARTDADVAIVKTDSPDPVGVGQMVTYRLTVTNNGPAIATNVTVSDTLPASMLFISATPSIGSCSGTTTITCTLGTLPVGNSQFVNIIVQATATGTFSNTATVTATQPDPVPSNNSSTATTTVLAVTLVRLRDFTVTQDKKNVLITWQTSYESDNLGFNVYRDIGGQLTKINKHLIAGSTFQSKKHDVDNAHVYRLGDKLDPGTFAQYWLEDVDTAGVHTKHGPISPTPGAPSGPPNATSLQGLGDGGAVFDSPDGFGATHATTQEAALPAQYTQQLVLAADNGLKIFVSKEGLYRLTRAAMVAGGFDPGSDPKAISLYMLGAEQAIIVDDGGDGKFDSNDAIEFYGYPLDSISTGARTYWLRAKKGNENRIASSPNNGGDPITGSVPYRYDRVERSLFFGSLISNGDEGNFFGSIIGDWTTIEPMTVGNLDTSYGGNAQFDIGIQGGLGVTHRIDITMNGHELGVVTLEKTEQNNYTFQFPQSWLVAGENDVALTSLNGYDDASLIVKDRLTYQHLLRADNGALEVSLPGGRAVTIGGFGSNAVRAFDITDAQHPIALQVAVAPDPQGGVAATLTTPPGASRTILAVDDTRLLAPGELSANVPSSWSDTNGNSNGSKGPASLYIISNKAFTTAAASLKTVRDGQGVSTAIIDVDDLYDEFNFGIRAPEAIRSFFALALTWKRQPTGAILLGDASFDPRDYYGIGSVDYVPTKLVVTSYMKTASDDWFSDLNLDGIADIPIGRIPVRTAEDAALVIGKITSRGTPSGTWAKNALFVTDVSTDYDFAGVATSLKKLMPSSLTSQTIDFTTSSSPHNDIVNAMNNGSLLTTYIGHASVDMWAVFVFTSADATALTNGNRLPVVIAMNCLNGYFHDPFSDGMAKALMKAPNGGAVAVWASSTLTQPDQQAQMTQSLYQQMFRTDVNLTLGEAMMRAKVAATDPDVRKSWILFGDPTMKLRP
ncbi:MAG: hypothetical protein QOK37_429 [Thermoanaerobaculia bacterium]|jgi:uncharacterized repeat protein (TIGR01451 family)|nr:hypothetical protein [Thermoanaerobaculia bacterium]